MLGLRILQISPMEHKGKLSSFQVHKLLLWPAISNKKIEKRLWNKKCDYLGEKLQLVTISY